MWKSSVGPWVGFTSTEGWGLELENWRFQSCVRPMGMTIVFQRRQTTYPRSHTTKWNKTRARKRLAWCPVGRAPLFLSQSPSELRLTKDFTPKEARSFSDPLIPPPATSSTECQQQAVRSTSPSSRIMGFFLRPPWLAN